MTAASSSRPGESGRDLPRTLLRWGIVAAVLLIGAMVLSSVLPRWWAQRIGNLVDGRLTFGWVLGLVIGLVGTYAPLLLAMWAYQQRRRRQLLVGLAVLAVVTVLPNLMTLWVAVGNGNAAHAGDRILDVDGPGFRAGTVAGVVVGALVFAYVLWQTVQARRGRRERASRRQADRQPFDEDPPPWVDGGTDPSRSG